MKKIKLLLILTISVFSFSLVVDAASGSLSVSSTKIENGGKVSASVSIKGAAAWNIKIESGGVTSGCSQRFADATSDGKNTSKTFTVTCKSTSTGIINFTLSGDITSEDGTNVKLSGSKNVTVTVPREKSTNNYLKSLSVTGFELSPIFEKDNKEYSVTVPSTTEKITIEATKADSYASISGTGEKDVTEGTNEFEIVVTSETGKENVYKITVNVLDERPINVEIEGIKYTVVKEKKNLVKPDLFDETEISINDFKIPAFYSETTKITLIGLKNEEGKINLFIYDNNNYSKFDEYISNKISLIFTKLSNIPKEFKETKIKINDENITAYKNDKDIILSAINLETGKENIYRYDKEEGTIQLFNIDGYNNKIKKEKEYLYIIYGISALSLLLFLIIIIILCKNKKKLIKLKDKLLTLETENKYQKKAYDKNPNNKRNIEKKEKEDKSLEE